MRSYRPNGAHVDTPDPDVPLSRSSIELKIKQLRAKQERMPAHWVDRRAEVGDEIDDLVTQWLGVDE